MDHSMINIENDGISDEVTIKVKFADEDYHDLVIDWSDRSGPHKGKQVIHQLASITGFPSESIELVHMRFTNPRDNVTIAQVENSYVWNDHEFTKEDCSAALNDGDCFAISTKMCFAEDNADHYIANRGDLSVRIDLYSRGMFTDDGCTLNYCHYSNTKAFLNRQLAIFRNTEFLMKLKAESPPPEPGAELEAFWEYNRQRAIIYQDLGIIPFIKPQLCRVNNEPQFPNLTPDYARTRG